MSTKQLAAARLPNVHFDVQRVIVTPPSLSSKNVKLVSIEEQMPALPSQVASLMESRDFYQRQQRQLQQQIETEYGVNQRNIKGHAFLFQPVSTSANDNTDNTDTTPKAPNVTELGETRFKSLNNFTAALSDTYSLSGLAQRLNAVVELADHEQQLMAKSNLSSGASTPISKAKSHRGAASRRHTSARRNKLHRTPTQTHTTRESNSSSSRGGLLHASASAPQLSTPPPRHLHSNGASSSPEIASPGSSRLPTTAQLDSARLSQHLDTHHTSPPPPSLPLFAASSSSANNYNYNNNYNNSNSNSHNNSTSHISLHSPSSKAGPDIRLAPPPDEESPSVRRKFKRTASVLDRILNGSFGTGGTSSVAGTSRPPSTTSNSNSNTTHNNIGHSKNHNSSSKSLPPMGIVVETDNASAEGHTATPNTLQFRSQRRFASSHEFSHIFTEADLSRATMQAQYATDIMSALSAWRKVFEIARQVGNSNVEAQSCKELGDIMMKKKMSDKAREFYELMVLAAIRSHNLREQQQAHRSLGLCAYSRKEYKTATVKFKKFLHLSWELQDTDSELEAYDMLGIQYFFLGKTEKSERYHEKLLKGRYVDKDSPDIRKMDSLSGSKFALQNLVWKSGAYVSNEKKDIIINGTNGPNGTSAPNGPNATVINSKNNNNNNNNNNKGAGKNEAGLNSNSIADGDLSGIASKSKVGASGDINLNATLKGMKHTSTVSVGAKRSMLKALYLQTEIAHRKAHGTVDWL